MLRTTTRVHAEYIRHIIWHHVAVRRETVRSATAALELVRRYMKLRRPAVTIENGDGEQLSFFQLKELVELEKSEKEDAKRR
jgi:hypothetical protein